MSYKRYLTFNISSKLSCWFWHLKSINGISLTYSSSMDLFANTCWALSDSAQLWNVWSTHEHLLQKPNKSNQAALLMYNKCSTYAGSARVQLLDISIIGNCNNASSVLLLLRQSVARWIGRLPLLAIFARMPCYSTRHGGFLGKTGQASFHMSCGSKSYPFSSRNSLILIKYPRQMHSFNWNYFNHNF